MFRQDPVEFLTATAQRYGDLVHFRGLEGHVYQFNHPALIQELMVDNERRNRRAGVMQRARGVLGDGLLTSEEPLHMRQRRMAAPAFHRQRVAAYGDVIAGFAAESSARWQPGLLDMHPQVLLLALKIVGKCLFDIDAESDARKIAAAVDAFMTSPPPAFLPFLEQIQKLPFGPMLKVRRGVEALDALIYGMIRERRAAPGDRGDLLSMLLEAEDTEAPAVTGNGAGNAMSDKQVRDECLTVILAGHETTADGLSFALWLLAKHPEAQEKVHEEAVRVLGARQPAAPDYPELRHAYMVFAEAMRLYPPVWVLGRSCGPEPYTFRGFTIPPGSTLLAPQIVVHRDPRFWQDAERFYPERFAADRSAERSEKRSPERSGDEKAPRPKFAYFPFGGGSRQCIGESLAWMEGVFVLATIFRDWRVRPAPGAPEVLPVTPAINLRPTHGVPLVLERR